MNKPIDYWRKMIEKSKRPKKGEKRERTAEARNVELTFTEAMLEKVKELGALLLNKQQIQTAMGIKPATWYRAEARDSRIVEAIEAGFTSTIQMAANVMVEGARDGDRKCAEFLLKTKGRFITESKTTSDVNANVVHNIELPDKLSVDPVEASKIYQRIMMET